MKKSLAGGCCGGELAWTFWALLHSQNHEPLAVFRVVGLLLGGSVSTVSDGDASAGASSFLSPLAAWPLAGALSSPFVLASGSSEGVVPGSGVLEAASTLAWPALFALAASV